MVIQSMNGRLELLKSEVRKRGVPWVGDGNDSSKHDVERGDLSSGHAGRLVSDQSVVDPCGKQSGSDHDNVDGVHL